jgi:hypothetical protein
VALAVLATPAAVLIAVVAATTSFRTQSLAWLDRGGVAAWSTGCWAESTAHDGRVYTLPCARVDGFVLYRERHDPDGDGDRHALVAAGRQLVIVKMPRGSRTASLPGPGRHLTAVGFLDKGRFGLPVVETTHVER